MQRVWSARISNGWRKQRKGDWTVGGVKSDEKEEKPRKLLR